MQGIGFHTTGLSRTFRAMRFGSCLAFVCGLMLAATIIAAPHAADAYSSPGKPTGYVNDFANIIDDATQAEIEQKLAQFAASTTNEISVVTIQSLGGDYIENYAEKLFKEWGIGTEKNDNGVLLLVAFEDRKMRIEVGYGLEGALTDSTASSIIRNTLTPRFKDSEYGLGISEASDRIMEATRGEYAAESGNGSESGNGEGIWGVIAFIVLGFGITFLQFLAAVLGRSKSWWFGGLLGALAGLILIIIAAGSLPLVIGIIIALVLTGMGLLFDFVVSKTYKKAKKNHSAYPWWIGGGSHGGWGSSSRSGGGFGGFSGGSSGGGGASGGW